MRGTPNDSQDDLSGKRAPGAAPCPKETSRTCESFAFAGKSSIRIIRAHGLPRQASTRHATQDEQTCGRALRRQREIGWWMGRIACTRTVGASCVGTGAKGSTCASHRGSAASFRGSLQEFFLIVGVGFRKLGPRSLSATPEYVILAGICFPRSEACATFGLLAQELERVELPSRAWCVRTVKLAL